MSRACGPQRRSSSCFRFGSDGLPAILQGYFQRVFLPGVALRIDRGRAVSSQYLWHLKRLAARRAYGEGPARRRLSARRFVRYNIGALIDPKGRFEYLALYDMNFTTAPRRAAFLKRVTRAFEAW